MVITVDGPAAAGKSTVARELAKRLRFLYLDTGAMYRAVTWQALQDGVDMADPAELARVAERSRVELAPTDGGFRVLCGGRDVTAEIRTPEVTQSIYRMADEPAVRKVLIDRQREFARQHDVVAEGRDQGTDVFPDAAVKFYLDASLDERARRRLCETQASGREVSQEEVRRQVDERDRKDCSRPVGALRRCDDMILIDSTAMNVDQVVETMLAEVARRGLAGRR